MQEAKSPISDIDKQNCDLEDVQNDVQNEKFISEKDYVYNILYNYSQVINLEPESLIKQAKTVDGSVVLRYQKIKRYSNGYRIILKKSYFDEGKLELIQKPETESKKDYIVIVIPEKSKFLSEFDEKEQDNIFRERDQFLLRIKSILHNFQYPKPDIDVTGNNLRFTFSKDFDLRCLDAAVDPRYVNQLMDLCDFTGNFYYMMDVGKEKFIEKIKESINKGIPVIARNQPSDVESKVWELIIGYRENGFYKRFEGKKNRFW